MRLKWKLVLVRLEIVLILTQDRSTVSLNVQLAQKTFWTHPTEILGDVGHVESCSVHVEIVLVSMQDSCTVSVNVP
jgi:hypothetical protein